MLSIKPTVRAELIYCESAGIQNGAESRQAQREDIQKVDAARFLFSCLYKSRNSPI